MRKQLLEWIEIPKFKEQNKRWINRLREEYIQFKGYQKDQDGKLSIEEEEDVTQTIEKILDFIIKEVDPTYNANKPNHANQFQQWILVLFQRSPKDSTNFDKGLSNYRIQLDKYNEYIKKIKEDRSINLDSNGNPILSPQIMKYKSLEELNKQIDKFEDKNDIKIKEYPNIPEEVDELIEKEEILKLKEFDKYILFIPFTEEQSRQLGKGTNKWCTAYTERDSTFYSHPYYESPLFILRNKMVYKDNYQFFFGKKDVEYKDNQNKTIDLEKFSEENEEVIDFFMEFASNKEYDNLWNKVTKHYKKNKLSSKEKFMNNVNPEDYGQQYDDDGMWYLDGVGYSTFEALVDEIIHAYSIDLDDQQGLAWISKDSIKNSILFSPITQPKIEEYIEKNKDDKNVIVQSIEKRVKTDLDFENINKIVRKKDDIKTILTQTRGKQIRSFPNVHDDLRQYQVGMDQENLLFIDDPTPFVQREQMKDTLKSSFKILSMILDKGIIPEEEVQLIQVKRDSYGSVLKKLLSEKIEVSTNVIKEQFLTIFSRDNQMMGFDYDNFIETLKKYNIEVKQEWVEKAALEVPQVLNYFPDSDKDSYLKTLKENPISVILLYRENPKFKNMFDLDMAYKTLEFLINFVENSKDNFEEDKQKDLHIIYNELYNEQTQEEQENFIKNYYKLYTEKTKDLRQFGFVGTTIISVLPKRLQINPEFQISLQTNRLQLEFLKILYLVYTCVLKQKEDILVLSNEDIITIFKNVKDITVFQFFNGWYPRRIDLNHREDIDNLIIEKIEDNRIDFFMFLKLLPLNPSKKLLINIYKIQSITNDVGKIWSYLGEDNKEIIQKELSLKEQKKSFKKLLQI